MTFPRFFHWVMAAGFLLIPVRLSSAQAPPFPQPLLRLSLERFGWAKVPADLRRRSFWRPVSSPKVLIGHKGKAYLGFFVYGGVKLRTRGEPNGIYRTLKIDLHSGTVEAISDTRTRENPHDSLYLTSQDTLVAWIGNHVQTDFEKKTGARFTVPEGTYLYQSASRKTFLLIRDVNDDRWEETVLDPDTLIVKEHCLAWQVGGSGPENVGDSSMIMEDSRNIGSTKRFLVNFCGASREVEPLIREKSGLPFSIDDSRYLDAGDQYLAFLNVKTGVLFHVDLPKHQEFDIDSADIAPDGSWVAIPVEGTRGGSEWLDISPTPVSVRIDVYDLKARARTASIPLPFSRESGPDFTWAAADYCLSPDGRTLAVVNDGELQVYRVPSSNH